MALTRSARSELLAIRRLPYRGLLGKTLVAAAAVSAIRGSVGSVHRRARLSWISTSLDASFRADDWRHPKRKFRVWIDRAELTGMLTFGVVLTLHDRIERSRAAAIPPGGETENQERGLRARLVRGVRPARLTATRASHAAAGAIASGRGALRAPGHPYRVTAQLPDQLTVRLRRHPPGESHDAAEEIVADGDAPAQSPADAAALETSLS